MYHSIKLIFLKLSQKVYQKRKEVAGQVIHKVFGNRIEKMMPQKNNLRNYWVGWANQKEQDENYPLFKNNQHARAN